MCSSPFLRSFFAQQLCTAGVYSGEYLPQPLDLGTRVVPQGQQTGVRQRQLQRQVLIAGRVKTMNESIYYNIDKLHSAIGEGKQIRFQYFQWTVEKKEALRRDGGWYCVSPWHLRWDDENYYLIAYDAEADRVKHYRVDKMKRITLLEAPRLGQERMARFDPAVYTQRLFGMYGGQPVRVTLEGENEMVGVLIDRFGKEVPVLPVDLSLIHI